MSETTRCPKCGLMIASNAPRGLCPGCLFKGALEMHASLSNDGVSADGFGEVPPTVEELAPNFPDLEILRFIGRGGMGMVYQARQKQLDRMVALKLLSPRIARDPTFAERFVREAKTMAMLSHPHVVAVYDFGTTSPTGAVHCEIPLYYFLMEFVDGLTLRQLLDAGQLTPPQAFAIVPQICEALQYAHDKGVVHRDIKPENLLLDRQGSVKIADFGLAKLMGLQGHDISISATGQVLGTLHYMAPEQTERPLEVDHRADIYSLGVVFYQMLTGELPLGRFAPPSQKVLLDVRLDEVVLRALEKEPGRRYQQASALQTQIESIAMTPLGNAQNEPQFRGSRRSWMFDKIRRSTSLQRTAAAIAVFSLLGFVSFLRLTTARGFQSAHLTLADSPQDLARTTKEKVIQAGLDKPLSPWAWQELERRSITAADGNKIVDELTKWLRREHPSGMDEPLSWLDNFLKKLDEKGLVSEQSKLQFLEILHGELHLLKAYRLREGTQELHLHFTLKNHWIHDLFDMAFMNELQSVAIDGERVSIAKSGMGIRWKDQYSYQVLNLPLLKPGKHRLRLEVLSALVPESSLIGLNELANSADWPISKKRWTRGAETDLVVYSMDDDIVSLTDESDLDPVRHGFRMEPILVRREGGQQQAVLSFIMDRESLTVPLSFDVDLRIKEQLVPCGSLFGIKNLGGWLKSGSESGKQYHRSGMILTVALPEIDDAVKDMDVILTPNPKWIELQPEVDRIWGKEIVFQKVLLKRLDTEKPPSEGWRDSNPQ